MRFGCEGNHPVSSTSPAWKETVQTLPFCQLDSQKHTQTSPYREATIRELTICRAVYVYPVRGNERWALMYQFCIYVRTGSGDRHVALG